MSAQILNGKEVAKAVRAEAERSIETARTIPGRMGMAGCRTRYATSRFALIT